VTYISPAMQIPDPHKQTHELFVYAKKSNRSLSNIENPLKWWEEERITPVFKPENMKQGTIHKK
jgi:hypothetical protein